MSFQTSNPPILLHFNVSFSVYSASHLDWSVLNIPLFFNYCSCFFICRESVYFRRTEPVSTALRSFLRWITCTQRRLFTVTWRWTPSKISAFIFTIISYKPIHMCCSSWKTWCWIRTVTWRSLILACVRRASPTRPPWKRSAGPRSIWPLRYLFKRSSGNTHAGFSSI